MKSHLTADGYFEQVEFSTTARSDDGTLAPDSVFLKWDQFAVECERAMGKSLRIFNTIKKSLLDAGFVDVVETRFKWPIGPWSSDPRMKEIGRWSREFWEYGMEGWAMAPSTRFLGVCFYRFKDSVRSLSQSTLTIYLCPEQWSLEQVRSFLAETKKALYDRRVHVYYEMCVMSQIVFPISY
jgi:hypothetical protein